MTLAAGSCAQGPQKKRVGEVAVKAFCLPVQCGTCMAHFLSFIDRVTVWFITVVWLWLYGYPRVVIVHRSGLFVHIRRPVRCTGVQVTMCCMAAPRVVLRCGGSDPRAPSSVVACAW